MKHVIDIETLGTPENSGYSIVIPNYAVVEIPENATSDLNWLYVQLPIQDQLDIGLKTDAPAMDFWFNVCAQEFPLALCEMQKSFKLQSVSAVNSKGTVYEGSNVPLILKDFIHGSSEISKDTKVFGNGCHFDCSILQENHRLLFGDANLWHYTAPNNVRTLRLLLTEQEEEQMKETVHPILEEFCEKVDSLEIMYPLCLHNPLFDAAKEALYTSYMLSLIKSY